MKKIIFLLTSILVLTTGCISYTELNDIGIVNAIGINKVNKKYEITINMLIPEDDNLEQTKQFTTTSNNLDEAINNLYSKSLRKIYLSHVDLLILSNNLEQKDYDNIINLFFNRNDSRNTFSTIIVKNYNTDNIFKTKPDNINSLIKVNSEENGLVKIKQFDDVVKDILEKDISYIPIIELKEEPNILGYKTIYSDNKILSTNESLAYNFITNDITQATIISKKENINFKINESITNIKIDKNNITIEINSNITILSNDTNITNESKIKKIYEKELQSLLTNYIDNNEHSYFYNLVKKYDYNYYTNNPDKKLNFKFKISSSINENSNTIGGNNYENQ